MFATLKRLVIGAPIATAEEGQQRLSKKIALPVFASDAISSTADATPGAVSVAGGVLAIKTATGFSSEWTVPVCLACVLVMTLANLRGTKESGSVFAGPTYFYVLMLLILIVTGLYRIFVHEPG